MRPKAPPATGADGHPTEPSELIGMICAWFESHKSAGTTLQRWRAVAGSLCAQATAADDFAGGGDFEGTAGKSSLLHLLSLVDREEGRLNGLVKAAERSGSEDQQCLAEWVRWRDYWRAILLIPSQVRELLAYVEGWVSQKSTEAAKSYALRDRKFSAFAQCIESATLSDAAEAATASLAFASSELERITGDAIMFGTRDLDIPSLMKHLPSTPSEVSGPSAGTQVRDDLAARVLELEERYRVFQAMETALWNRSIREHEHRERDHEDLSENQKAARRARIRGIVHLAKNFHSDVEDEPSLKNARALELFRLTLTETCEDRGDGLTAQALEEILSPSQDPTSAVTGSADGHSVLTIALETALNRCPDLRIPREESDPKRSSGQGKRAAISSARSLSPINDESDLTNMDDSQNETFIAKGSKRQKMEPSADMVDAWNEEHDVSNLSEANSDSVCGEDGSNAPALPKWQSPTLSIRTKDGSGRSPLPGSRSTDA